MDILIRFGDNKDHCTYARNLYVIKSERGFTIDIYVIGSSMNGASCFVREYYKDERGREMRWKELIDLMVLSSNDIVAKQ
jgi:hypothetical protein